MQASQDILISSVKSLAPSPVTIIDSDEDDSDTTAAGSKSQIHCDESTSKQVKVEVKPQKNGTVTAESELKKGDNTLKRSRSSINNRRVSLVSSAVANEDYFSKFIEKCREIDASSDMQKILESKILKIYYKSEDACKNSPSFHSEVKNLYLKLQIHPEDVYVFISYLREEMKRATQSTPSFKRVKIDDTSIPKGKTESINEKDLSCITRLSKALQKLQKKIIQLEAEEVHWDSEGEADSSYIQLQRYKERAVRVHEKLCSLTKESKHAGNIKNICFSGTPFTEVNRCIEKFVNSTGQFPDYKDILEVVQKANSEKNLNLREEQLQATARKAFSEVGKQLQVLRQTADAESIFLLVSEHTTDPAENDQELQRKLESNKKHWNKIHEIIDEFAEKQDKNPVDSGDESNDNEEDEEEEDGSEEKDGNLSDIICSDSDNDSVEEVEKDVNHSNVAPISENGSVFDVRTDMKPNKSAQGACSISEELPSKETSSNKTCTSNCSDQESNAQCSKKSNENLSDDMTKTENIIQETSLVDSENPLKKNENVVEATGNLSKGTDYESYDGGETKENPVVIPNDSCDDVVILDDSGEDSADGEKCKEIQKIKAEVEDSKIFQGKIKVKPMSSLCDPSYC